MKLNNKGFALTSIIYMLIVLFLMIMLLVLANLATRKTVLDKIKKDVKDKLNQTVSISAQDLPYQNTKSGIFFETLNDAFGNAKTGETIKVLKDVKEITPATNTQGTQDKPVVLDLNGKTIDYVANDSGGKVIENTGTLEIKDTASNGKITTSTITNYGNILLNRGNLILTSGKIEVAGSSSANAIFIAGNVTINGGEITNAHSGNSGIFILSGNLKFTNGNINVEGYGIYNNAGKVEINNGNIKSNLHSAMYNNSTNGNSTDNPVIKITGGTLSSNSCAIYNNKSNTTVYITGGNLSSTGNNVIDSVGNVVMTNGTIDAYSGSGIICTGSGNATISGGTITKKINPVTNQWVGGATFETANGNGLITGTAVVQSEAGNGSNVIYNGGSGTLTIDGNATVENKSAVYVGTNASTGKIIVKNGTVKSLGLALYNAGTGSIEVQGGTVKTNGGNYTLSNGSTGSIIVSGGQITTDANAAGIYNSSTGTLKMTGGTINVAIHGLRTINGNVEVTGGTVMSSAGDAIWGSGTGNVTVTNGTITGYTNGIVMTGTGNTTVTGGTISVTGASRAINSSGGGSVTIGTNDSGMPSQTSPNIVGKTYGVYATGTFNFYDGKITGASGQSVSKAPTTPTGYSRKVASNGTTETSTLGWATDSNDTLIINDGTEYSKSSTLASNQYEDFKGYTINAPFAANEVFQLEVDVKGSGYMYNYFYGGANYWQIQTIQPLGGTAKGGGDGNNRIDLTSEWKHYEVRFTLKPTGNANVYKTLLFRVFGGNTAYIKNVKFYKIN